MPAHRIPCRIFTVRFPFSLKKLSGYSSKFFYYFFSRFLYNENAHIFSSMPVGRNFIVPPAGIVKNKTHNEGYDIS